MSEPGGRTEVTGLNGRPLRKVWSEVEHGESFIRVLQINHQQTVKLTNALHDPSPDESNLVSWKRHQKYLAEPVKPQANNLG